MKRLLVLLFFLASATNLPAGELEKRTERAFMLKTNGAWDQVTRLVKQGIIPNARGPRGWTLLHYSNDPALTRALIEAGADVNIQGAGIDPDLAPMRMLFRFWTPEDYMAKAMKDIAERGKDLAPLHTVRNPEVARILIEAGAQVNIQDAYGRTPLHHANTVDMVQVLIEAGADVNIVSSYGTSPLANAADDFRDLGVQHGLETYFPIMKMLLEAGANPNTQDNIGHTALHVYDKRNPPEIVTYLIDHGADPFLKTNFGDSPFCYAIADNRKNTVLAYLAARPGLVFDTCSEGRDILGYAQEKANADMQAFLLKAARLIIKDLRESAGQKENE